jgi:uncharacterized coiled-coil protein SlyX
MKSGLVLLFGASLWLVPVPSRAGQPGTFPTGVPNMDTRVSNLEAEVPRLDERVGSLEVTVEEQGVVGTTLGDQVQTLQGQMADVQTELLVLLQNKLLFAVVDANGTLRTSRGVLSAAQSVDDDGNPVTGHYDVIFTRDVSACAVTVTAEPQFSGGIVASINGTFRGSPIHDQRRFHVVLSDHDNDRVSTRFNIIVMC